MFSATGPLARRRTTRTSQPRPPILPCEEALSSTGLFRSWFDREAEVALCAVGVHGDHMPLHAVTSWRKWRQVRKQNLPVGAVVMDGRGLHRSARRIVD